MYGTWGKQFQYLHSWNRNWIVGKNVIERYTIPVQNLISKLSHENWQPISIIYALQQIVSNCLYKVDNDWKIHTAILDQSKTVPSWKSVLDVILYTLVWLKQDPQPILLVLKLETEHFFSHPPENLTLMRIIFLERYGYDGQCFHMNITCYDGLFDIVWYRCCSSHCVEVEHTFNFANWTRDHWYMEGRNIIA